MACELIKVNKKYYKSLEEYRRLMLDNKSSFDGCFCLEEYEDIEKWHLNSLLYEKEDTLPPGYSIGYMYLLIDNDEVVGMSNIRPKALEHPYLKQYGGHIGYSIRPDKRRRGLGKVILSESLKICKDEYQLDKVLITCFKDNIGSKKIIVSNGGIYENEVIYPPENKLMERYWINI